MKSIKKTLCLFLTILMMVSAITPVMANGDIKVKIDGQQIAFDVPPQLINDRTMVPLRAIFEALGATVEWDNDTQTVTSTKDKTTISLAINNPTMYVNGAAVTLDSPACLVSGRTLVPVRAISEAFGTTVEWIGNENTVLIDSQNEEPKEILAEKIVLDTTTLNMVAEESKQLNYTIYPENAINKDVEWKSDNTSVVKVVNGKVTAVKEGSAIITITTDNNKYATCEVKVNPKPIEWYSSSMYRVGSDIPAGDYYAVATGSYGGYYCKYTDSTQDDIEDNDNFDTFTFFRCYDGQYLKLSRCKITPIENAPVYSSNNGIYEEGTYRVGIDIPAGEYKFTATDSRYSGYYCVYTDITYKDIEENDNFDDVAYYTIKKGQYLNLNRCTAVRVGNGKNSSSSQSSSRYEENDDYDNEISNSDDNSNDMSAVEKLVEYIERNGKTEKGYKQIELSKGSVVSAITYRDDLDKLIFHSTINGSSGQVAVVSFDYDIEKEKSASKISFMYNEEGSGAFLTGDAKFDISSYTASTKLTYDLVLKTGLNISGTSVEDEKYFTLANSSTKLAVSAWNAMLRDKIQIRLSDIGFDSY